MSDLPDNYPVSIDPSSSRPQALLEDIYEYTRNPKTPRYKSQTGDEGEE